MGHYDEILERIEMEGKKIMQVTQADTQEDDPFTRQEGGSHYTDMKIQPFEYSMTNGLDPMQHTIIKYVSRFRAKNGVEDLRKAKHVIDLLIAWEGTDEISG